VRTRALVCALIAAPAAAHANPYSVVPSGGEAGTAAAVTIDYEYEVDKSVITRERVGTDIADTVSGAIPKTKDLLYHQYKHTVTPKLDVGVFPDTWITVALPIIIQQSRELRLADGVDRADSTTLQDGFVPTDGYDAADPTTAPGGDLVFRGHTRHGLSQIRLGIATAPMNQRRDPSKPTWRLGTEVRLAIGKQMDFSQGIPDRTGVSTGVDELRVWTSLDKRLGRFEPWFELFWQTPIAVRSSSLIQNPGFGTSNVTAGQIGGASFGVEGYAVDDPVNGNKISLDFGARVVAHFEGRDYSEMWEVFAYAGDAHVADNPLILDSDPTKAGVQSMSHPGVTNIENYLETAARLALRAQLGPHVSVAALVDLAWKSDHDITFADAGIDLPTCPSGVTAHCEADDNNVINPGTVEVNPLHQAKIDLAGHRYHAEDSFSLVIGVMGQFVF
jgi:hypothetical protein